MASFAQSSLLLTLVLLSMVASSLQLECYECTDVAVDANLLRNTPASARGTPVQCGNLTGVTSRTCAENEVCTKTVVTTPVSDTTITTVSRSCGTEVSCVSANVANVVCKSCTKDKCNGASGLAAATSLIAAALFCKFY